MRLPTQFLAVGVELESENPRAGSFNLPEGWRFDHDASIETNKKGFSGIPIEGDIDNIYNLETYTYGTELVSRIFQPDEELIRQMKLITGALRNAGENDESYRAGFHVHVSLPANLQIAKNIIRLGRFLEPAIFLMGGMGYDYRGIKNNSTYCRPITKFGPQVVPVKTGKTYAQCFNISDLLISKTLAEFALKYGDLPSHDGTKYVPVRYSWLNLVPFLREQCPHLEFRIFNKSLNPYYLYSVIEFCKIFVTYVVDASFREQKNDGLIEENSIFDFQEKSKEDIIKLYTHFMDVVSIHADWNDIILEIMQKTNFESVWTPPEFVFSHLQFHSGGSRVKNHWYGLDYDPKRIDVSLVKQPIFIDVHNLGQPARRRYETFINPLAEEYANPEEIDEPEEEEPEEYFEPEDNN